jgi:hypothetical protein
VTLFNSLRIRTLSVEGHLPGFGGAPGPELVVAADERRRRGK